MYVSPASSLAHAPHSYFDKPQLRLISNRLLITSSSWLWLNKSYAYAMKDLSTNRLCHRLTEWMIERWIDWSIYLTVKAKVLESTYSTRKVTDKSIIIRWLLLCMSCINFMQSQLPHLPPISLVENIDLARSLLWIYISVETIKTRYIWSCICSCLDCLDIFWPVVIWENQILKQERCGSRDL